MKFTNLFDFIVFLLYFIYCIFCERCTKQKYKITEKQQRNSYVNSYLTAVEMHIFSALNYSGLTPYCSWILYSSAPFLMTRGTEGHCQSRAINYSSMSGRPISPIVHCHYLSSIQAILWSLCSC